MGSIQPIKSSSLPLDLITSLLSLKPSLPICQHIKLKLYISLPLPGYPPCQDSHYSVPSALLTFLGLVCLFVSFLESPLCTFFCRVSKTWCNLAPHPPSPSAGPCCSVGLPVMKLAEQYENSLFVVAFLLAVFKL